MAAVSARSALPSLKQNHVSPHRVQSVETAVLPSCCNYKKQGLSLSRACQNVAKKGLGGFSALRTLSAWGGKQHLGQFPAGLLQGTSRRGVSRTAARGLVTASLLGVGAPEALVIGVVALLVFGPKGLAEVARNLGKTLKTFQPTIKELQDVSREFRSTLEQEIGLDEIRDPYRTPPPPPQQPASLPTSATPPAAEAAPKPAPGKEEDRPSPRAYTTDEMLRVTEDQAKALVSEDKRKAAEAAAWGGQVPSARANDGAAEKPAEAEKVGSTKESSS
ncbi:Twin-arginine translocation protein [Klebsormidium nitens]|uniref:Twin-arginine translocation protein n=1 Tax=Klebsormidium nitens TaxID=105231 RepID=A0A0U9HS16_KLENI|nr:Twin-arginine translocation protein [Klebsormidium nitens]|eukprot:GAQ85461.1 Twin-arginine translocation protein [Klebsormidium nitens]